MQSGSVLAAALGMRVSRSTVRIRVPLINFHVHLLRELHVYGNVYVGSIDALLEVRSNVKATVEDGVKMSSERRNRKEKRNTIDDTNPIDNWQTHKSLDEDRLRPLARLAQLDSRLSCLVLFFPSDSPRRNSLH